MGKLYKLTILISVLFLEFAALPQIVNAAEKEAGEAAKLASSAAVVSEKKPDKRTLILTRYLESVKSPLASHADIFVREADEHNLDWRLVPAIAGLESSFGKRIPTGSYNPFGWGVFTGKSYGINFANWEDAISTVTQGIREKYIDDGLTTVEAIGYRYAASQTWAPRIRFFMNEFEKKSTIEDEIALTL